MPQLTVSITAPGTQADNGLLNVELPSDSAVKDLKAFIQAETNLPSASQSLYLNGRLLADETQTLEHAGISHGDMLAVFVQPTQSSARPSGQPEVERVRQQLLSNTNAQNELARRDPELIAAISDPARWREAFMARQRQADEANQQRQRQIALLNHDPFDIEAQRKIEELIRQDRVVENLQEAYERNPEVFVSVHMLYVNTEVNGVPVKAFVDSGAQATIMSPSCAERCGIMRLIDMRYAGTARGVGTAKILGRVHSAEIKIGGAVMPCAFTVMEGKEVDLLFGLDMLKRHRAKIDLEKNALCLEGIEVPFLHESEIPKNLEEAEMNEPTVAGPNGTEIGARSGAVRPKGATVAGKHTVAAGPSKSTSLAASTTLPSLASASQPSASTAPASTSSTATTTTTSSSVPSEHVQQLVGMFGCSEQQATQALEMFGGNVDAAASFLLG